ncbi:MAG: phosphotransferase [Candidatus Thorarchaeota archaeon]|nr:MAG: phosphotransferase [Candidatus Thorarchaeota archaeon]
MEEFDADLHIHSHHSIGVSKNMTVPNLVEGARQKGLSILGTGDVTQPGWLGHLRNTLKERDETLIHDDIAFVLSVEIEDVEAIHHLVFLPGFESVVALKESLREYSSNLDHQWGGRPRVNIRGEQLAGFVRDVGGLIGPAHAFTPFRSIFREGRYEDLVGCYGSEVDSVKFIELGLSADSKMADCIPSLRELTFLTCSDAHSPSPAKLGREFVRFRIERRNFPEIRLAILREKGRAPVLNVGLNPRLGKYYLSFCSACRRTIILEPGDSSPSFDDLNIYISFSDAKERQSILRAIHDRAVFCPHDGKTLRLGVRDRAVMIGGGDESKPLHRPPYIHIPPLLELITSALGVSSPSSKKARTLYERLRESLGPETTILTSTPIDSLHELDSAVAGMISAFREGSVNYIPGGGGRYGRLIPPWKNDSQ